LQFPSDVGFVFLGQVIKDVAFHMDLAALNPGHLAGMPPHRRVQNFAASRMYSRGVEKSTPPSTNSLNRLLTTAAFSVAPVSGEPSQWPHATAQNEMLLGTSVAQERARRSEVVGAKCPMRAR
jgi:hypothetical protein